ncbi:hypothetical protein CCAX7_51600 [Capsulimonas corticalis]|uniref:Uncharacterized protein n=2 Tax=Capsulimonas corticalis TaxID=2219043 RepID=A0A402CPE4_9BACT|nr:hypothetical protein CCAX7_51600 [Capsulimonas corticalis]
MGGAGGAWMQIAANAVYTEANGATYVNSVYDENGREAGIYREGSVVGSFTGLHGWQRGGGKCITADDKYVYLGMVQSDLNDNGAHGPGWPVGGPGAGGTVTHESWFGVRRYFKNGLPAPWSQSGRKDGNSSSIIGLFDNSMIVVSDNTYADKTLLPDAAIMGLAVVNGLLYASDTHSNKVRIYNISNSNRVIPVGSWNIVNAGAIVFDKNSHTLWIAQTGDGAQAPGVLHYTLDGNKLPQQITGIGCPRSLAITPQGNLLVADSGPDQQVKMYSSINTAPVLVSTLGNPGGIYSGLRGQVGDYKFNGLTGVSVDAAGNIYVVTNGSEAQGIFGSGATLMSFNQDFNCRWKLEGLEFMDCADVAPGSDGANIYTKNKRFKLDLTDPTAKPQYAGYTVDSVRYPNDSRLHINTSSSPLVRNIQGKQFLFVQDTYSAYLQIYRFDTKNAGEIAIPSGLIGACHSAAGKPATAWPPDTVQPSLGPWIWRDIDGNGDFFKDGVPQKGEFDNGLGSRDPWLTASIWGWCVDENGDIWQVSRGTSMLNGGIRHFRCLGLDSIGNPIYTLAASQILPRPAPFDGTAGSINRIEYVAATDTMYLCGYTNAYPISPGEWGLAGRVIVRYDHWSTPARTQTYQIVLNWNMQAYPLIGAKAMTVSGDKIFVGYVAGATADFGVNGGQIVTYDAASGRFLGTISAGPEAGGVSGLIDTTSGLRAFTRTNGDQMVFAEEDLMGKVLMYRVSAPGAAATTPAVPVSGTGTGLTGKYYNGSQQAAFNKLITTRVDPTLNFQWTTPPAPTMNTAGYSVQWTGNVQPRYSETYNFQTDSSHGVRVWIDGKMVIDSWNSHSLQTDFGSVAMLAGTQYKIRVEYYQISGTGALTLSWSSASQIKEIIPQTQLYPDAPQ